MASHYDPDADIALIQLAEHEPGGQVADACDWGLIIRDEATDALVGFEVWQASQRLPAQLVSALPQLTGDDVTIAPQAAA
jgi:uncharacterized protein YuzE